MHNIIARRVRAEADTKYFVHDYVRNVYRAAIYVITSHDTSERMLEVEKEEKKEKKLK